MKRSIQHRAAGERRVTGVGGYAYHALSAAMISALAASSAHAGGTRIETDGRTATDVASGNNRSDITTDTVRGRNAFNSFRHFRVGKGHEANLQLPDGTANLINLVHDSRAVVDGTLNSFKAGEIGGNVVFADPHGFVVGASGTVNVGTLGVATPRAAFMDRVISPSGEIGTGAVDDLLDGDFEVAPDAVIRIDGRVNADESVRLLAGEVMIGGTVDVSDPGASDADAEALFNEAVNTDGLARADSLEAGSGGIVVAAEGDAEIDGDLTADGAGDDGEGGTVVVTAGDTVALGDDASIDVSGTGADADGGTAMIWGDRRAEVAAGARFDAEAGETGDGGLVEVSAREHVQLDALSADLSGGGDGEAGTFVVDPETVTAGSTEYYTDGGNVEIIADDSITVEAGATINTRDIDDTDFDNDKTSADAEDQASTGDSGDIHLEAPEITLEGDGNDNDGASVLSFATGDYDAGAITLQAGEDAQSDTDITDEAIIDIQSGATVDAGARGNGAAGDVTASALAIDRLASGVGAATADVDVTGDIVGRDIAVNAEARTLIDLETAESADEVTAEEDITDRIQAQIEDPGDLTENLDSLPGSFAVAEGDATVDVNDGADLTAARDLDIGAEATRLVDIADDGGIGGKSGSTKLELAVLYGQVSGATRAAVAEGASVSVGRDLAVEATSDDTLKAAANAVGGKQKTEDNGSTAYNKSGVTIGGALSIGYADTTTEATLDGDVTVAEDVDVAARADNEYAATASFTLEERKIDGDRVTGLTAAIGDFNSAVDARLGSDIATAGNVQVTADSETEGNRAEATTGVSARRRTTHVDSNAGGSRAAEGASGKSTAPLDQQSGGSGKGIQLGGAIAIGLTDLSADARIDDGTEVVTDGNVAVQGRVTQSEIRTIAESGLSVKGAQEDSLVSLATGITVARHEQEARALIGNDALVEADAVGVRADSETPITANFPDDWTSPGDWDSIEDAVDTVQNVGDAASAAGDLGNNLFSSYTTAKAKTPTDLSLTGSVNYFGVDHTTEAWIGQDADVTARGTGGTAPDEWSAALDADTDWQYENAVDVRARSHTGVVTGAGVMSKLTGGGDSATTGAGGVFSWVDLDATTSAGIANDATVDAGEHGIGVDATTDNLVVQVLPAAGKGASIGVAGVFGLTTANSTTRAAIAESADIDAGSVAVDARQHFGAYGLSGAIMLAENAGVGASAFVHNVETTTEARVDGLETDEGDRILPDALDDGRAFADADTITTPDLDINAAADGRLVSIAIAGAVARDKDSKKQGATGSQSTNQQNQSGSANDTTQDQVQGESGGGQGANDTLTSSSDRLRQRSEGNTDQEALSGGSRDDRDQKQQQPKFGLAASASGTFNRTRMRTDARLAGATVEGPAGGSDTDVRVRAVNDVDAIAAAGAAALTMGGKGGQKSKFETALAGAAGVNWLENDTTAAIDGATVSGAEAVRVQGLTAGDQVAIGLALAISSGGQKNLAISGSGSLNLIRGSTGAYVEDAELTAGDADDTTTEVVAYDRSRSLTGGGAFFGASGQGAGLGAAATLAYIANDIDAGIHSSSVTDFATVDVEALTSSQMLLAAVTAGGGTKVAIGGAFYGAYIGNSLSARIDDGGDSGDEASVTGAGDVTVRATGVDAFAELDDVAGGDTPGWLGGADALTDNDQLTQEINPAPDTEESDGLGDGAEAEPMLGGDLSGEMVLGVAGAVQGGRNSGSLAFGFSMIDTSYEAVIDGASVEASGDVDVTAANQATIAGVGFGVAGGGQGAFTGSAVANVVRADVEARIGSDRDQSGAGGVDLADDEYRASVDAARVNVGASANGAIYAFSGNVAASGNNAGGAAIAYNSIGGDVRARLAAADITTTATATEDDPYAVTVDAARRSAVRAIGAAGQFSGSTTIGGTLVVSDLLGSTAATVDDGSDVDTDALAVRASDGGDELSGLWTLAGNIGASGSNAIGGAFSVNTISRTQTAAIDDSTVAADGEVKVDSEALANIRTLAVAGGASGSVAASGSLTVNTLIGDEIARVDDSTIDAGGLDVDATGGRSIWSLAGSASASGSTAVGFAGAVNTIRGERAARISGASDINVGGGTVGVESGGSTDIVSLAVAGAASGSTAVGGSLAVNTIVRDGVAEVLGGEITADAVELDAADSDTSIHALAGSASGSGSASVGAGVTVNTIKGDRRALIDDVDLDVAERVDVEAVTGGTIRSAGVAAAVGGTTGVGGAVTTNVLDATVEAGIRDTRSRDNGQDTTVRARDVAEIDSLGGQVSGGATAGVGASAAVNRIGNSVEAFVEGRHADGDYLVDDMTVSAQSRPQIRTAAIGGAGSGEGASVAGSLATNIVTSQTRAAIRGGAHVIARDDLALTASDRAVVRVLGGTASFSGRAGVAGTATFNLLEGDTEALIQGASTEVAALGLDPNDNLSVNSGSLADGAPSPSEWSDPEDFNPVDDLDESEKDVNGLAVRASSVQQVGVIGTAVSGTVPRLTGSGSGAGVGNVNVVGGQTRAAIEDATINPAAAGSPHGTADVEVGASSHVFNVGYVFAASGGGWGALAGSLDTNVVQRTTEADIDGAAVNAGDAVRVDADSTQAATSFALGASGAGAALTGTVSLGVIRGETRAAIDGGSDIDSDSGGVTVEADTGIDAVTTGGAAGGGATAIGASFGIAATEADTEATIAGDATRVTTPGAVRVDAATETGLTPASATASFGASAAVAGAASIGVIGNTTEATVDGAAVGTGGDRVGSLSVEATDHVTVDTVAGAIGISAQDVGVGAGAGVLVLQSDTRAEILGADVYSSGDVDVTAEREADLLLAATTGGGGSGAGLAGSIGVIVIGDGSVTSDSEDFDSPDSELDAGGDGTLSEISEIIADKDVDASTSHDDPLQTVDEGDDPDNPDESLATTEGSALDGDERDSLNASGTYDPADRYQNRSADQTVARIDSSTIDAGGTVDVDATNRTATHNVAGALGVGGAVGAGLGIGVTRVYNEVTAAVDDSSVTASGIEVDAVATDLGDGATALVDAYVGAAGGFAGAAVNVADARIDDTVTARVDNSTLTGSGGDAAVRAEDTASVSSNAYGAAVAGGVGVTVVYAGAERDGTVDSRLDPASTVSGFHDVTLDATSDAPTIARGWAGSGGLLGAGTGTVVSARDAVNTATTVAGGAEVDVTGRVDIDATARPGVTADALGIALGGYAGVGVSTALATAEPDVNAKIEDGASIDAGALQVDATRGVTTGSTDQGLAGNAIADQFDSGPACNGVAGTDTCAFARGASGGTLVGANATASDADSRGSTTAAIGDVTLPGGDVELSATSTTGQYTEATGFSAGIVAAGANLAWARTDVTTRAELDSGVDRHNGDGDLDVTADSSNDATGKAVAGSGGVVSGVASRVDTRDESRTEAELGGGSESAPLNAGDVAIEAIHDSTYSGSVNSVQASVVGASGARAEHRVTPDVDATVAGDTHLVAGSIDIAAETRVDNPRASDYDLTSGSGGVVDAAAVRADSHIAPQTDVVFGDGVDFDIPGDWRDSGNDLVVAATNTFDIDQRVKLDSGGAISVARGESIIELDGASTGVDTGDATLHTVGDLVLAARTKADLDARANVKTYGGAGAAQGESRTTARTTNRVEVGADADFKAWGQMDLQAGRNAIGEEGLLDLTARTDLWNKTAFPVETDPVADAIADQTNTLSIGSGAELRGVRDVTLAADDGRRLLTGSGTGKDLYRKAGEDIANGIGDIVGADEVSMDIKYSNTVDESADHVTVDGEVRAGVHSQQTLTVDEDLTASEQSPGITFDVEVRNLAAEIQDRIDELYDMLEDYDGVEVARDAFEAEISLLERRLSELGGNGEEDAGAPRDVNVQFVEVDPILARPGSIDVTGDSLAGGGALRAPGDAAIDINQNGPAFLEVTGLDIPADEGGEITFNYTPVSSNADINNLNSGGGTAAFGTVETAENSDDPLIEVDTTFNPDLQTPPDDVTCEDCNPIDPSIFVTGEIRNLRGTVDMEATTGNVRVTSEIRANTVDIAAGDTLTLSYVDTFRHIGGDPRVGGYGGTLVAGNNVIASARYLNINGTIQSGIADWSLHLDEDDRERIENAWYDVKLRDRDNEAGTPAVIYDASEDRIELEGVEVRGGYMELSGQIMNTGRGDLWDIDLQEVSTRNSGPIAAANEADTKISLGARETGSGVANLYWNGAEEQFELDGAEIENASNFNGNTSFRAQSGRIHVRTAGHAFEAKNAVDDADIDPVGELRILDGYGRIDIDNDTGYDLHANALDAGNDVEGTLRINDTATSAGGDTTTTVFKRLGGDVVEYRELDNGTLNEIETYSDTRSASYSPEKNLKFAWLTGTDFREKRVTQRFTDEAIGFIPSGDGEIHDQYTVELDEAPLDDAEFVTTGDVREGTIDVDTDDWETVSRRNWSECETSSPGVCWEWRYWSEEVEVRGRTEIDRHAIAADNPIDIRFTGQDSPDVAVANGDAALTLGGGVSAPTGSVDIDAGHIERTGEGAVVSADDIDLDAQRGIEAVQVDATGSVRAVTDRGAVEIGGTGALPVERIASGDGAVNIDAGGDVTSVGAGTVIAGSDVTVNSGAGSVGTDTRHVNIDSGVGAEGVVNIDAGGDVFITETDGDLRADRIVARGGDLGVVVSDGAIVDANTEQTRDERAREDLLAAWGDMALRAQDGADEAVDAQVQAFERRQERIHDIYWQEVRNLTTDGDGDFVADDFDPDTFEYELPDGERQDLLDNGASEDMIAAMESERETAILRMHEDVLDSPQDASAFNPDFTYTATDADRASFETGSVWTTEQLENSIAAGLAKGTTDTTTRIEEENFVASGRIDLVADRIGAETAEDVVIDVSGDDISLTDDERVALASAEPDDLDITDSQITVEQREDVDIDAGGAVTATADSDVFIGGQAEVNVEDVSGGAVRIKTAGDVLTAAPDQVVVDGHRVILESGSGTLGTAADPVAVDVGDRLTARGGDGVHIAQDSTLTLQRITSDAEVGVTIDNGDLLAGPDEGIDVLAGGPVTLDVADDVGAAGDPLDIEGGAVLLDTVGGDAWLAGKQFSGGLVDMELDASDIAGTLDIADVRSLDVIGGVETGSFVVDAGSLGTTITDGQSVTADDGITITGALLDMAADSSLLGDRVEADVAGAIDFADIRARGGAAATDLRLVAGDAIQGIDSGARLTNDSGLTRLEGGTSIGAADAPVAVRVDRLHAEALDGDLYLSSDRDITFAERSGATDADGLATTRIDARGITDADLIGDTLQVDAANIAGPRLEARASAMDLNIEGLADIEDLIGGAGVTIDAGELRLAQGTIADALSVTTTARNALAGDQQFGTVDSGGPMSLTADGGLRATDLRSTGSAIDIDAADAVLTRADASTDLDVATRAFQDHEHLRAGGAMTLAAGGALEWAIARGDAGFTATADGPITSGAVTDTDVADGETVFAGDIAIDGEADVDLNDPVVSTNGDIDLSAARALTAERLRADTGAITVTDTDSAALDDVDATGTLDVITGGFQDHENLHADGAITLAAGGPLEWAIATGDSAFTATADGPITSGAVTDADVADGETAFAGDIAIDGEADVDLNDPVVSSNGDIDLSAADTLTVERLRAETGPIAIADTNAAYVDDGRAAQTLEIDTAGDQGHGTLESAQAMTLSAGGDLDYTHLSGDATLDTDVTGTATGAEAVFDDTITATGSGDYDLGRVETTGADVMATVDGAFDVATLRSLNGRVDIDAGSSAIDDGESGETIDIVTGGAQDHGRLLATEALRFEAGIDHAGVESSWSGGPETGADFEAMEIESLDDDIHVDAGYAAVETGVAAADGAEIRIHTSGEQAHGQADPDARGQLRADGLVELTGGGTVTLREVIAGKDSDDPATGGDAVIESVNGDIIGNRIVASRDIILMALNGGLELERLDYGGTYTLEAGRDIVAGFQDDFDSSDGELSAGRHIEVTTTGGGDEDGDILLGGAEAERGHLILDAAGDIVVGEATVGGQVTSGDLVAGDFIDLTAGGRIEVDNAVDAGTTIDASAEGGDLAVGGRLHSGGQQTLHAEAALTTPEITSGAGVEATAGSMDLGDVTAATDVDLDAVRDIVVLSVDTGEDQSIEAGDTFDFERLTAEGRIDSHSTGDTSGGRVSAARPVRMVAGLDGDSVEQASDLRLDRLEAPVATLLAGDELAVDTAYLRERADLEARDGALGIVHTGADDLLLDVTGPGDRVADRFDLDIDAPAPGAVLTDTLYSAFADIDTNAVEVDIRDAWIPRRLELDTDRASLLADNRDPATRAYDFQLHELDQRFRARVDGYHLFTTAYTVYFDMGYSVDVPNFIASHERKETEIGGQSAERNGLRRLVPPPMPEAGTRDDRAPAELLIDESEPGRGPINIDLAELGRRLQADRGDDNEDRTF